MVDGADVAVLGGGIQGTLVALALANGGMRVRLFERESGLLRCATRAAEGKIHCGYTYALDRSGDTGRLLMRHALGFVPNLREIAGDADFDLRFSARMVYALHRDSQLDLERTIEHFDRLARWRDELVAAGLPAPPWEGDGPPRHRVFHPEELAAHYGKSVKAAIEAPEAALVMPRFLDRLEAIVTAHPRIEVRLRSEVAGFGGRARRLRVRLRGGGEDGPFAAVVNCSWDSLLELDRGAGLEPLAPWSFRRKAGVHGCVGTSHGFPPTTFSFGPFGDLVPFDDGRFYASWYPSCRLGIERSLVPPATWRHEAREIAQPTLVDATLAVMAELAPRFRAAAGATLAAGVIFAYGDEDIHVDSSRLHRRTDIGVRVRGRYVSVNTGKLGAAPAHALEVRRMLAG